ncbi:MAG: DUF5103 domain-containing protein [Bacteroidaceae bacterium]|nr:DUF5103 domain-containing protein [Bacteroidaceae bacterium]
MKRLILALSLLSVCAVVASAQQTRSLDEQIRTVRVIVDDNPFLPPVARLGTPVEISFDHLSHAYTRYIYKVELCNADWTPASDVFESDYLQGFNGRPIEDYETSLNTTVLYTHYRVSFPNEDTRLLLPGNYRVSVYADEVDASEEPVLEACFSLLRNEMGISAQVSSNTDIDFNQHHHQVTYSLGYGERRVVDPERELHTVVMQNRRWDNAVVDLPPNIRKANGAEWTHRRELIFPAGAEFHKFEILDVRLNGMGIDRMEWYEPEYHATLLPSMPLRNYTYDQDVNGGYVVRCTDGYDDDTETEYLFVHFLLQTPPLRGGDVYVCGQWDNGFPDPQCLMKYNEQRHAYECGVLLKQGYYNYQFRQLSPSGVGLTALTEGDFYQTENEYIILVYHRPQGSRYDALVGFAQFTSNGDH